MRLSIVAVAAFTTARFGFALFASLHPAPAPNLLLPPCHIHDAASSPAEVRLRCATTPQSPTSISPYPLLRLSPRDFSSDDDGPSSAAAEGRPGGYRTTPTSASTRARFRTAHGTLMAIAFTILFPTGAVVMATTHIAWIHGTIQVFAYMTAIAGLGLGVWLGTNVRYLDYAHTVIGMCVLAALLFQLVLGIWAHHVYLRGKVSGREKEGGEGSGGRGKGRSGLSWGVLHRWVGRGLIALGIANGGVGLRLAQNTTAGTIAYGVVAGVVGVGFIVLLLVRAWKARKISAGDESVMT